MAELEPIVYTARQVAQLMAISVSQVHREIAAGRMPVVRYGRAVRIPRWWVDEKMTVGRRAS